MKRLLVVLGWLAVAAVTTATSTWAISLLGEGLSRHVVTPLSAQQVDEALAGATTVPATPPATPHAPAATASKAFPTRGGSVVGGCAGHDQALLLSWSPAQGYAAGDIDKGPGSTATLEFESDSDKIKVEIRCEDGFPVINTQAGVD
ncbi:hypothetical protein ABZ297_35270 [Nonomuraea sp. NPDC005983]|uniref:hypothetical protein n=1 Tax=Nonomuraea sp. NPDC005983 TaxID=3155595 RepID=UPI0033BFA26C